MRGVPNQELNASRPRISRPLAFWMPPRHTTQTFTHQGRRTMLREADAFSHSRRKPSEVNMASETSEKLTFMPTTTVSETAIMCSQRARSRISSLTVWVSSRPATQSLLNLREKRPSANARHISTQRLRLSWCMTRRRSPRFNVITPTSLTRPSCPWSCAANSRKISSQRCLRRSTCLRNKLIPKFSIWSRTNNQLRARDFSRPTTKDKHLVLEDKLLSRASCDTHKQFNLNQNK